MTDSGSRPSVRVRPLLVVALAACLLCIAQNLALFALAPWHHLLGRVSTWWIMLPLVWVGAMPLLLVPVAFALGWVVARGSDRSGERRPS